MKKTVAAGLVLVVLILGFAAIVVFKESSKTSVSPSSQPTLADAHQQLWTCGMHPQVIQDHPGSCPICHMKLTPMRASGDRGPSSSEGLPAVVIDAAVVQNMGVRNAKVTHGPLVRSVRTVGVLEVPETGLHDISPKVGGWIERLYANQEGLHVQKGDPLFDLYSPDLVVAEEELVGAMRSLRALGPTADDALRRSSESLVESAKRKLRLLDVSDEDVASIADKLVAERTVTFRSPASGVVVEKAVVQGSATQVGQKLMRIEDHGTLWLQLPVYEQQMSLVAVGDDVQVTAGAMPGKTFNGRITFVHPHVDPMSRTEMARAELENREQSLRPGMYGSATILSKSAADVVQAPREAIIDTGTRQIAFVVKSEGHFEPRVVHTGVDGDDGRVQVIDGLVPGEKVVTSGQFLFDVESRTTEAIEKLRSTPATTPTNSSTESMVLTPTMAPATPSTPTNALNVVWCPMKKALWLQRGDAIANPYYGSAMLDCGEVQRKTAVADPSSPLILVIDAYLHIQEALTADRLDKDAAAALGQAAEALADAEMADLRSTVQKVASASDVKSARIAFAPLSDALVRAIAPPTTMPVTVRQADEVQR